MGDLPVHNRNPLEYNKHYTRCGRKIRSIMKTNTFIHHVTCLQCKQSMTKEYAEKGIEIESLSLYEPRPI